MPRLIEEAKKFVQIRSVSPDGNEEIANYAANLMQNMGLKVTLQKVLHSLEGVSKRQFNVIGVLGDPLVDRKIRKGLLLQTHLDTVGAGLPAYWTTTNGRPFAGEVKEQRIYGVGAANSKLDFLCKLHSLQRFRDKKLKEPVYLVGTCGEKIGMFGSKYLIQSLTLNPKYTLIGKPTDLRLAHAHKGLSVFRISTGYSVIERGARGFNRKFTLHAYGKATHSAFAEEGSNAIEQLVVFLKRAMEQGFDIQFSDIKGGTSVNQVPDQASANCYLTSHQLEDFKRFFRQVQKQAGENQFDVELGGVGDTGIRFLPEVLFSSIVDIFSSLRSLAEDLAHERDESFEPAVSTVNIGKVEQTPGRTDILFDVRLLPGVSPAEVKEKIQRAVVQIAAQYPSLNVTVRRERMSPGLQMKNDVELMRVCKEVMKDLGEDVRTGKLSVATEAGFYAEKGFDALVFGPGAIGQSHGPNEYNDMEQMQKATLFYERLIERVCL